MATGKQLENSKDLPRAPTEICDRHSHKQIDMYCQNHDNVGCSTCIAVDHRSCKDTYYIPTFIQNNTYQGECRQIQIQLKVLAETLANQADRLKKNKEMLLKRKADLLDDIRKFRQEINNHLDKLEESSIDEIEVKVKCLENKIEYSLKQLQANKSRITSANDKLASKNTNRSEVFVYVKMAEDVANVANKYIEDAKSKSTVEDLDFQPDRTILTQLKLKKSLGTLLEKSSAVNLLQITRKKSYQVKILKKSDDDLKLGKKKWKIAKKDCTPDKKDCDITSACCMENGTIILADSNNMKLKRLHFYKYTVTDDYCNLPKGSHQVCMINKAQVAVTDPSKKEVHFISLSGKMKLTSTLKTDCECYGLAYANKHLYISDSETSVYMYDMSGRKLNTFTTRTSAKRLQNDIPSLAVSKDGTRIYVADRDNGLTVLDNNGQVITSFNDKQLDWASSCYLTEAGSVLVSGYFSKNILQFTCDGELIGEVIKVDGEKGLIKSFCYNQLMAKLCVSKYGMNYIDVYDIDIDVSRSS